MNELNLFYIKGFKDGFTKGVENTSPNWNSTDFWLYRQGYDYGVKKHCEVIEEKH